MFLFLAGPPVALAGVSVSLGLDRNNAPVDTPIGMVVTVTGTQKAGSEPIIKGLEDFQVTRRGSTSRLWIINGRLTATVEYRYLIQAKKPGTFQIGPARVEVKGKITESNRETLIIQGEPPKSPDKVPLFLSGTPSKARVYVGEQVVYSLKLYRRIKVYDISVELPEIEHIRFRQLGRPIEYQSEQNGLRYKVIEVRYVLIPTKEGNYSIPPFRMDLTVYESRRGFPGGLFEDPFFDPPLFMRGRPVILASRPFELEVTPLPEPERPHDFSGLVGSFKVESSLSRTKIRVGESATLTIRLRGSGNIDRLLPIEGPKIRHIEVHAHEPVLIVDANPKGFAGVQIMKWDLVPEIEGEYKIPPQSISFFEPETHQYRTLRTLEHTLLVLPQKGKMIMVSVDDRSDI